MQVKHTFKLKHLQTDLKEISYFQWKKKASVLSLKKQLNI